MKTLAARAHPDATRPIAEPSFAEQPLPALRWRAQETARDATFAPLANARPRTDTGPRSLPAGLGQANWRQRGVAENMDLRSIL
ncbi:MAG TPA: hypothetical protein VK281_02765, partial [Xanthobacteraceae bacterium]|nr:hypothetical protein [Xanthobacteraceae bacterium]